MDIQVYAQSNIFPRVKVYDSTTPPGPLASLIKLGYEVKAGGVTVVKSKEQPQVSPWIQYGGAALVLLITLSLARWALR